MTDLPVEECIGAVREALASAGSAVLQAPPGAGKTTIVPLRLLDSYERMVMLEPRRLATRAAAARMASLLGEEVGGTVGYTTRDERRVGPGTRIEVVTEGVLTRRLQRDRSLPGVGLVIFDEVHERNLNTDVALALTLDTRHSGDDGVPARSRDGVPARSRDGVPARSRPDLRVLAMSATIEADRVAALLDGAPVISSEGRQHPVDVRWSPTRPRDRVVEVVPGAVLRALRENEGDLLVFLAGAGDIRRVERVLAGGALPEGVDVRPLFGALPIAEQDAALMPSRAGRRRVVLATDIAETSLTVEGVRTVVDTGQVRVPRYDARSGLTRLQTVSTSRASADQRAGRAGRTAPGVAYRLWSKVEHAARRPFPDPEIAMVDLAGLVLELALWGRTPGELQFLDAPPAGAMEEGRALLEMLGALDGSGRPTEDGRAMAELPLHPRLARMVVSWPGWLACMLAALLEDRDVLRGRPDELPVDVTERVRLIADRGARHAALDVGAVAWARRRAEELARRIRTPAAVTAFGHAAGVDLRDCGEVLALAYPDRIAQARGGARFRLRNGTGAWVPKADPLAGEPFLVVAELDLDKRDSRVRMAAALAADRVVQAAGTAPETVAEIAWDDDTGELRSTVTRRVDGLVLERAGRSVPTGRAATEALLAQVRSSKLSALRWTPAARALQARAAFLRRVFGEEWPDLSDAILLATLDEWLAPRLASATKRAHLQAVDMAAVLRDRLGPERVRRLDELAPTTVTVGGARRRKPLTVDYRGEAPTASARVQDLFGTTVHPAVAGGRVPVVLQLLSPADRPVQVTSDLPGFWSGSYASVRKEMAGRYPKHRWPVDPSAPSSS